MCVSVFTNTYICACVCAYVCIRNIWYTYELRQFDLCLLSRTMMVIVEISSDTKLNSWLVSAYRAVLPHTFDWAVRFCYTLGYPRSHEFPWGIAIKGIITYGAKLSTDYNFSFMGNFFKKRLQYYNIMKYCNYQMRCNFPYQKLSQKYCMDLYSTCPCRLWNRRIGQLWM